jgi:hypothetical protein
MPAAQYIPDAEFAPAPASARVRLATMLSTVAVFLAIIVSVILMVRDRNPPPRPVFGAIGIIPVAFALTLFAARIRRYRLVGGELLVEFLFRTARFPLAGLISATADPEAMRHAWKIYGNDGLGSVSGRFRSKRLGAFRAYLTDAERAVVLRWPDRCLVISPDQPTYFIEAVRKRAGLSR